MPQEAVPQPGALGHPADQLPNGLRVRRVRVPLGVVGMIYEARPNVTVDVAALNFRFGFEGRGSASLLESFCREDGAAFFAEDLLEGEGGGKISSSAIRSRVRRGDVSGAAADLGYPWFLRTDVLHGDERGRRLGYPTANLNIGGIYHRLIQSRHQNAKERTTRHSYP